MGTAFLTTFITLAVVMDPLGNVPVFLSLSSNRDAKGRARAATQAVFVALILIGGFALAGRAVLEYLDVSVQALSVAGGLLLALIALEMLRGHYDDPDVSERGNIALVPLGTPLLAGPGAIAATMVLIERNPGASERVGVALGILAAMVTVAGVAVGCADRFEGLHQRDPPAVPRHGAPACRRCRGVGVHGGSGLDHDVRMSSPDHVSLAQRGFAAADRYERARPGYPEDAVGALCEALGLGPSRCVMDLAAGTGKLTAALEATGARVVAVEPLDAMRGELQRRLPTVTTVAAYAEELPYADGSFDAVTVAQAFHWFDGPAALREVRRVLRPAGGFGLVWNVMDRSVAWVDALQELIHQYRGSSPWYAGHGWRSAFTPESGFDELRHESFANLQQVDADAVVDRVASISFIATLPDRTRSDVLAEARRIADAAGAGEPGFAIPYVTDVFVATRQE